jgi:hypothetical protein
MPKYEATSPAPTRVKESEREKLARPRLQMGQEVISPAFFAAMLAAFYGLGLDLGIRAFQWGGAIGFVTLVVLYLLYLWQSGIVLAEVWREEESPAPDPFPADRSLTVNTPRRVVEVQRFGPRRVIAGPEWAWDFTGRDVTRVCGWIESGDLGVRREKSGNGRGFEDFGMGGNDYSIFLAALRKLNLVSEHGRLTEWNERGVAFWTGSPTPDGERVPTVVQVHDDSRGADDG